MEKITSTLLMACALLLSVSCKKHSDTTPFQTTGISAPLITGTYTAVKIEGSNINNATDWADITKAGVREQLTIRPDNTFISATSNSATGATATPITGTWSLSADGNTLSYVGIQDYTIAALTTSSLVTVLKGPNKLAGTNGTVYTYYRFTYTRQQPYF